MLRTSNSPTPLLQEDTAPQTPGKLVEAAIIHQHHQCISRTQQQQGTPIKSRKRPAPLRIQNESLSGPHYSPLVIADDSKPELGDLGLGIGAATLLRLPGLPA